MTTRFAILGVFTILVLPTTIWALSRHNTAPKPTLLRFDDSAATFELKEKETVVVVVTVGAANPTNFSEEYVIGIACDKEQPFIEGGSVFEAKANSFTTTPFAWRFEAEAGHHMIHVSAVQPMHRNSVLIANVNFSHGKVESLRDIEALEDAGP